MQCGSQPGVYHIQFVTDKMRALTHKRFQIIQINTNVRVEVVSKSGKDVQLTIAGCLDVPDIYAETVLVSVMYTRR